MSDDDRIDELQDTIIELGVKLADKQDELDRANERIAEMADAFDDIQALARRFS